MKVDDFLQLMQKVKSFKQKMDKNNICKRDQDIILKIYIAELTPKINVNFLEVI
ncbi:hypothetical protein [Proteiniborus sp. MB09-C3]|uniref:hypothetical protein n=1 Tax=Proteiniborus sp. MB09-C3 TaxID=3050072 RepID=UPI0025579124|nr:hypothetical protein [Proteiniborus sp. MB09-C3]WIV10523.1 hypothetical protein QO263_10160 [Proteiniborus sp. MB09-C3]